MKTMLIASVLAFALNASPLLAAGAAPTRDSACAVVACQPESPAAAFDRMLATRSPVTTAHSVDAAADPLDRHFHVALWTNEARSARRIASAPPAQSR